MNTLTTQMGELTCRIVGADQPSFAVVLCHGYGAPGTDLVPMAHELLRARPELAERVRFLFPEAPLELPGFFGGRAWWHIDIARYERAMRTGEIRDMRTEVPDGLPSSRRKLMGLLEAAQAEMGLPLGHFLLGGFSQGAMLATDVTLRLEDAPAGLAALSGTLLCEEEWRPRASKRAGLPVLQSHGTVDPILPFQAAEWLHEMLSESGLNVEFIPFHGAHTIPGEAMLSLAGMIERLAPAS